MNYFWKEENIKEIFPEFKIKKTDEYELNPMVHIGKKNFAGLYCYNCGIILNVLGTPWLHQSEVFFQNGSSVKNTQLSTCPKCGKKNSDPEPNTQTGISTCHSFTWTGMFQKEKLQELKKEKRKLIYDEDGDEYTPKQFLDSTKESVIAEFQTYTQFR